MLLVWLAYNNALRGAFAIDDASVIVQNTAVRGPADIPRYFVDTSTFSVLPGNRDYRPVWLSFMALCWWAGGGATLPFNLFGIALHTLNVLLLYVVLRQVFEAAAPRPLREDSRLAIDVGSACGAALFAVHPLATQAVNYISETSVPLTAVFYLACFASFLRVYGAGASLTPRRRAISLATSYGAYAVALLCKPIAITLPVTLLVWELVVNRERADGERWDPASLIRRAMKHVPFAVISLLYLQARSAVNVSGVSVVRATIARAMPDLSGMAGPTGPAPSSGPLWFEHPLTQTKALVFYYLKLAVAPFGQSADAEFPQVTSGADLQAWVAVLTIVIVAAALVRSWRHRDVVFFAVWFPVCLLLTTYLVDLIQVVAEHRIYLSLAGVCALAGRGIAHLFTRFPLQSSDLWVSRRLGRRATVALVLVLVVGLGSLTRARNTVWASPIALYGDAVQHGGTWRAVLNYGLALEADGRSDEALFQFERAVELGSYAVSHINLGLAYLKRGQSTRALDHMETAVRLWPTYPEAHLYRGYVLAQMGEDATAEQSYLTAAELGPRLVDTHRLLSEFYEQRGRWADAVASLRRIQEMDPGQAWVAPRVERIESGAGMLSRRVNVAFEHQQAGRRAEAITDYEAILAEVPDHHRVLFNLAYAYMQGSAHEWTRSVELFHRVLAVDPSYGEVHYHLATLYWRLGDTARARTHDATHLEVGVDSVMQAHSRERLDSPEGR